MPKALKTKNIRWIWAVIVADIFALIVFAYPTALDSGMLSGRTALKAIMIAVAPVIVQLLTSLMPSNMKASLVFWRIRDALPGHRAFSKYAAEDPRINVESLRKNLGEFPSLSREQNSLWYKLFKKVESDVIVSEAHQQYLLFRDIAALSLILAPIAFVALLTIGAKILTAGIVAGLLLIQYIVTALAARNHGTGLVSNVLALHGAADTRKATRGASKPKYRKR